MQVELAAHRAIGTDGPHDFIGATQRLGPEMLLGNELEDGPGGTNPDTLAAPGAAGMIRVAISSHNDLGVLAPHSDIEHADLLDVLTGTNAPGAEDAGAHIVLDHHIARPLVPLAERQV